MDYPSGWKVGSLVETHEELKERPKIQELLKRSVWKERRERQWEYLSRDEYLSADESLARVELADYDEYVRADEYLRYLYDHITLNEIQDFFINHPWLSILFRISSATPLEHILSYFRDVADVRIMTSDLEAAQDIPSQPIAIGGLADIYLATLGDGSQVAVKRLRQQPDSDNKELKRTARELDTWATLDHPNILKLLGLAEYHGQLSMVSPWMEHGSVVSVVRKSPNIDRYTLCAQLVNAVAYLHSINIVHGDIKGVNVLVDRDGVVMLTDFGLSIMHDQATRFSETDPGGGTTRWMAPELFADDGVRCRETDVYAMGMTMMEIATGRVPFSEIRSGPAVTMAVSRDRRIPQVPELRTTPSTPQVALMLTIMLSCWKYEAGDRITAETAQLLMTSLRPA